ncbi:MAG: 2Fe-2S iron-sulfur cluster-binding protein [Pseudomonadota bacterium]
MTDVHRITVHFHDAEGTCHTIAAPLGLSVMEALQDAGFVESECGGALACATCYVRVAAEVADLFAPPSFEEEVIQDVAFNVGPCSRLSCQLIVLAHLDGLTQ